MQLYHAYQYYLLLDCISSVLDAEITLLFFISIIDTIFLKIHIDWFLASELDQMTINGAKIPCKRDIVTKIQYV